MKLPGRGRRQGRDGVSLIAAAAARSLCPDRQTAMNLLLEGKMARRGFMDWLAIPWVDKSIAIVATIPFVIELYQRWVVGHVNFPRALLGIQVLVIIVVMVLRTAPVRVTPNPWYWLLAFVTTYATLGFSAYAEPGVTLISPLLGNGLAILSAIVIVYSLLSLGRNIGFIPAQRRLVTRGAYRFVRHPIYTGTFISLCAFVLRAFSPLNLAIALALIASLMLRGLVEEHFLREDPGYVAYLAEVRWRWFPGIG
jgi:protein-S-isoprenylcysteine O-methyltransferase Ste14